VSDDAREQTLISVSLLFVGGQYVSLHYEYLAFMLQEHSTRRMK
jgi:hypothetical protein